MQELSLKAKYSLKGAGSRNHKNLLSLSSLSLMCSVQILVDEMNPLFLFFYFIFLSMVAPQSRTDLQGAMLKYTKKIQLN